MRCIPCEESPRRICAVHARTDNLNDEVDVEIEKLKGENQALRGCGRTEAVVACEDCISCLKRRARALAHYVAQEDRYAEMLGLRTRDGGIVMWPPVDIGTAIQRLARERDEARQARRIAEEDAAQAKERLALEREHHKGTEAEHAAALAQGREELAKMRFAAERGLEVLEGHGFVGHAVTTLRAALSPEVSSGPAEQHDPADAPREASAIPDAATRREPKPVPNPGAPDVTELVKADLDARSAVGIESYGTPLQPMNGRNALVDAYQESLDLPKYLRQALEEQGEAFEVFAELRTRIRGPARKGDVLALARRLGMGQEFPAAKVAKVGQPAAACPRCIARGKTWKGDDPRCGFVDGRFVSDNWNCATLNTIRDLTEDEHRPAYEDNAVMTWRPDRTPGFIVLCWYKSRGRTDHAFTLSSDGIEPLTIEEAEEFIQEREAERRKAALR